MGLDAVEARIIGIASAARLSAGALREAVVAATEYNREVASTSAGLTNAGHSTTSIGSSNLGDPRDARGQAERMLAAIEAAKRR